MVTRWWDDRQYKFSSVFFPTLLTVSYGHNDIKFQNKLRP